MRSHRDPLGLGLPSSYASKKPYMPAPELIARESPVKSSAAPAANVSPASGENVSRVTPEKNPRPALDTASLTALVSGLLKSHYGARRHGAKLLSSDAGCNEKAAENWLAGKNAPSLLYAIRLMQALPGLRAEIMALVDHVPEFDPETLEAVERLVATVRAGTDQHRTHQSSEAARESENAPTPAR